MYEDVNGDGYPDIVRSYSIVYINGARTTRKEVWINNRDFTWTKSNTFIPPSLLWTYSAGWGANRNTDSDTDQFNFRDPYNYVPMAKGHLVDVNGDGLVDWVQSYKNFQQTPRRGVWLNNGSRWQAAPASQYQIPSAAILDDYWEYNSVGSSVKTTQFQDVNGDGLVDLVQSVKYNEGPNRLLRDLRNTWLNTGSGWTLNSNYKMPDVVLDYTQIGGNNATPLFSPQSRGNFVDVNGDGLVDWVQSYTDNKDKTTHRNTWLNDGDGWRLSVEYEPKGAVINNYHPTTGHQSGHPSGSFFDVNRDGLVDWVVAHKNLAGNTVRNTYLNTGSGWQLDNTFKLPNILIDSSIGWQKTAVQYGGIMDVNGDGATDYLMSSDNIFGNAVVKTYLGKAKPADLLNKIINTLGAEIGIVYKPMNDPSVYNNLLSETDYTLRKLKVTGPMPLVSDTSQSDGVGSKHWLKYHYYQALSDNKRGYSGFAQRRIWDSQQKMQTIKEFYQEFPSTGMTKRELTYTADNITSTGILGANQSLLNFQINFIKYKSDLGVQGSVLNFDRLANHPSGKSTYAPTIKRTLNNEYELGQNHYRRVWTQTKYDAFANPIEIITATTPYNITYEAINWDNSFWTKTTTLFSNNEASWLIGLPDKVTVEHHAPGQASQTRVTKTTFNGLGQPRWVIIEPDKPEFKVTTENKFEDGFGNQTGTVIRGAGLTARSSFVEYDSIGLHVISKTNAKGHTLTVVPDEKCEAPKRTTDANGLVTTIKYDQHCRVTRTDYPDGTWTTTVYPGNVDIRTIQRGKNQPEVITYFDQLGRAIRVVSEGFDGRRITTRTVYNSKGQVVRESLPYYNGANVYWTQYEYDAIGRLWRTTAPDNSKSTIEYDGLTTITTNSKNQTQTVTTDLLGRTKTVLDAYGKPLTYSYDAVGNLLKTRDPKGNEVKMGYDDVGRKKWMDDPDMGYWHYEYDVLGQLTKQTDAVGNVITSSYDKLGRLETRTTAEGTSTWEYDTATNGIGKLSVTMDASSYKRVHQYDQFSRPSWTHETVNGVLTKSRTTYNSNGKPASVYYPGRADAIGFEYHNTLGYLTRIVDKADNTDLWALDDMDAKGNVTQEHYGNGVNITRSYHNSRGYLKTVDSLLGSTPIQKLDYVMDSIGNLYSRHNRMTGTIETFIYDRLNRLRSNTHTPGVSQNAGEITFGYNYDELGNLIFRSDLGIMRYGERGFGPHAVTSILENQDVNVAENVFNPRGDYHYDANGNLLRNGPRSISWTSFNKPKQMRTTLNTNSRKVAYYYGTDFQRIRKYDQIINKNTRYFGGGSVERISQGSTIHWKYYIPVGAATLEFKYRQSGSNSSPTLTPIEKHYLFKDHLGSTDVIVDDDGHIIEDTSFNPWGERRDADWSEANDEITSHSTRGFTGHEMDDEIGVVNMKARIYDPVIGRFLSPDALIPNPGDLQSYNRYSYVTNNPLSFTDPTGHKKEYIPGGDFHEKGSYYKRIQYVKGYNGKDNEVYGYRYEKITDPGAKKHIGIRIGVVSDLIKNHGGVHRGTAKNLRNHYNKLAAQELAANGETAKYQNFLDKGYAAHVVYRDLKDKKRSGYIGMATKLVASAMAGGVVAGLESAVAQAAGSGLSSVAMSGGDLKAGLVAAATAGLGGTLHSITDLNSVAGIAAHGVVGGVASEIQGGGFAEGFIGNAVGKAITVGGNELFDSMSSGEFHAGQFAATVGGAALAAELSGGDGAMAGLQAAIGYATNQAYVAAGAEGSYGAAGAHLERGKFITLDGLTAYTSGGTRVTTSLLPHAEAYFELGYVNPAYRTGSSWLGELQLGFFGLHVRMSDGKFIGGGVNFSLKPSISASSAMEHTKTH